jgi:DNA modification methylase
MSLSKKLSTDVFKIAQEIHLPKEQAIKLARMDKEEQKEVILKIQSGEVKTVGHALAKNREEVKVKQYKDTVIAPIVTLESYKTWLDKQDKCDLLITDPPYITEFKLNDFEVFVKDFMSKCENKVKDTGSMYICIGGYPNELKTYLNLKTKMNLQNIMVWTYNNAIGIQPDNSYIQNYQMILYYRWDSSNKINKSINCMGQLSSFTYNAPDGRVGDKYHSWQKPMELAEQLILNSSKSGDTILDPFTCTGTFILAANKLGRIGKGCDISKDNLDLAIKRGCKYE